MLALLLLAVALSADGFAVSLCRATTHRGWTTALLTAGLFGSLHGLMICLGWLVGDFMEAWSSWAPYVACLVLILLGSKMLADAHTGQLEDRGSAGTSGSLTSLVVVALAISVDCVAAGVTMPLLGWPLWVAAGLVGGMTFTLSLLGHWLGERIGGAWGARAEVFGGWVLIFVGLHLLP